MNYILFEDQDVKQLQPLTINHASFEIRCGAFTNIERISDLLSDEDKLYLVVRKEISELVRERFPQFITNPDTIPSGLCLNGATVWDKPLIDSLENNRAYSYNGILIAMDLTDPVPTNEFSELLRKSIQVTLDIPVTHFQFLWDAIFSLNEILEHDSKLIITTRSGQIHQSVILENSDSIFIGDDTVVSPGVVLDASMGPIIIENNVKIDIGALIQGPVFIGENSTVNPGAKLRGNISIGPVCKIGGEVEDVILQSYSNKQHDGFLGHSYIGEWVNLGANTNNSDLKNNYSQIRVNLDRDLEINTMQQFMGVMIGDYSKSGISTMFNSGTVVGLGANIFGSGFQPKYIESFSWGNNEMTDFDKFIKTCSRMKSRREKELSKSEQKFIKEYYSSLE